MTEAQRGTRRPEPRAEPRPEPLNEEDALELLPWYATGKTTPAETQAIEQHLAASPHLKAELDLIKRERAVAAEDKHTLGEPAPEFVDRLLAQLDDTRQLPPIGGHARETAAQSAAGFLARLFGFTPSPALRLAAVAACLVIVVEGAAIVHLSTGRGGSGSYQTASAPDAAAEGPRLIVQFRPDAGMDPVATLLHEIDADIVRGPMPDGSFVVALPKGADVEAAIGQLKVRGDLVVSVDRGS